MGTLYVIATPIGNLADISFRAIEVLRSVDTIFCEDTRTTKKLLAHYDIITPCLSYHSFSGFGKITRAINALRAGESIALVSDAGTPTISDPGTVLVKAVRDADSNAHIVAVPGPSAVTAALSVSGAPASPFVFIGFLPRKKGKEQALRAISEETRTVVCYESPHRIMKTLQDLVRYLSDGREIIITREMTKVHEEVFAGTAADVLAYFQNNPERVRGEFVIIISARTV